jgi:Amt family ammonium transporter
VLAVGLFASSTAGVGGGSASGVDGLFYGGGFGLLSDQLIGGLAIAAFVAVTAGILFSVLKAVGWLRVGAEEELEGLDIAEHGSPGYGTDPTANESFVGAIPSTVSAPAG